MGWKIVPISLLQPGVICFIEKNQQIKKKT